MRAFLMALFMSLSISAFAQDPEPAAIEEIATEEVATEEKPAVPTEDVVSEETPEAVHEDEEAAEALTETVEGDELEVVVEDPKLDSELSDDEALEYIGLLVNALQGGKWPLAFGLLLSLIVYVGSRFGLKDLVGTKALPWVTMGVAVAGTVGAGLVAGLEIGAVASQGVLAGVAAIGGWELLLKHMLPKPAATEEPKADEPKADEPKADAPSE